MTDTAPTTTPETGPAEGVRTALGRELADVILEGGAISPRQLAGRLVALPEVAKLLAAEAARVAAVERAERAELTNRDLHRRAQKAEGFRERHGPGAAYLFRCRLRDRHARRTAEATAVALRRENAALRAEAFACRMHAAQVDRAGAPYAGHLDRVAARARAHAEAASAVPEFATLCAQAGWLHDVIEDTATTADDLRAAGFDPAVVRAVERLTRPEGTPYLDYVRAIIASGDPIAMTVKLADNEDNLDPSRPSTPRVSRSLLDRCRRSAELLRAALARHPEPADARGRTERTDHAR